MERHKIDLRDIKLAGRVLDIGGGGEGVISRYAGDSTIAIDIRKGELEESPEVGIKIVMDARDMQFLDNTFDNATCFFSLMFMSDETMEKVLREAFRVLKAGACLWIWDAILPPADGEGSFVVQLAVQLDHEEITTGYGIGWKGAYKGCGLHDILELCKKVGFGTVESHENEQTYFIKAVKA